MKGVLELHLEQSGDCVVQKKFCNGWSLDHYVVKVFVLEPSGEIISYAYNAPSPFHDSQISEWVKVYEKLELCFRETGGRRVVDSEFLRKENTFLIKYLQDHLYAVSDETEVMMLKKLLLL